MAFIALPDEHTAEFLFYRNPGADMLLHSSELDLDLLRQARAFHFGSISLIDEPIRSAAMAAVGIAAENGALVSFDVNYRPSLWPPNANPKPVIMEMISKVDLLKVNKDELEFLTGSTDLRWGSSILLDQGPALCVVTLGAEGSFFSSRGASRSAPTTSDGLIPPFPVKTVDSIGCGDAFTAGLLCRLVAAPNWREQLNPQRLREILRYANAAGALTAQKQGVIPALPTAAEVKAFLQSHL